MPSPTLYISRVRGGFTGGSVGKWVILWPSAGQSCLNKVTSKFYNKVRALFSLKVVCFMFYFGKSLRPGNVLSLKKIIKEDFLGFLMKIKKIRVPQ